MIVDAHSDLLIELWLREDEPNPFAGHWLQALRAGEVDVQVCAMGADPLARGSLLEQVLHQAAAFHKACRENADQVVMVRTAADFDAAAQSGRIGLMLALEGVDAIGRSVALAELLVDLGVRMVGLTWEMRNAAADGTGEPTGGGLSAFGRQLTRRMIERGVIMDVAHASRGTFDGVLELVADGGGSVICSHTGCAALRDIPRNLTDDQLRALAAAGGMVGIAAVPPLIDLHDRSVDRMVDHVVHAMDVAGEQHVGIGGDFMTRLLRTGLVKLPRDIADRFPSDLDITAPLDGLEGPEHYARLAEALRRRSLSDAQIEAVLSTNMSRFLKRAL
ncbi:MAG: membrane dipeptidase [Actinobacteria bacterium]|nr:membrane dipeptidase [Actinomycetota bacterium]